MSSHRRKFKKSTSKPADPVRALNNVAITSSLKNAKAADSGSSNLTPVIKRPPRTSPFQLASAKKFKPLTTEGVVCKFDQLSHPIPFDSRKKHDYQIPKEEITKITRMFHLRPEDLIVSPSQNHVEEQLLRCLLAQFQALDSYLPNWPARLPSKSRLAYYEMLETRANIPDNSLILDSLESIPNRQYCVDAMQCLHTAMKDLILSLPQPSVGVEVIIFAWDYFYKIFFTCYLLFFLQDGLRYSNFVGVSNDRQFDLVKLTKELHHFQLYQRRRRLVNESIVHKRTKIFSSVFSGILPDHGDEKPFQGRLCILYLSWYNQNFYSYTFLFSLCSWCQSIMDLVQNSGKISTGLFQSKISLRSSGFGRN